MRAHTAGSLEEVKALLAFLNLISPSIFYLPHLFYILSTPPLSPLLATGSKHSL